MGCVYLATNTETLNQYVGFTSKTLEARRNQHYKNAKLGYYPKSHFLNAIRKYGESVFTWRVLYESDDVEVLKETEIEMISKLSPEYNMTIGGDGSVRPGHPGCRHPLSEEHKRKISEALRSRPGPWKGMPVSEERKRKMSETLKRRWSERKLSMEPKPEKVYVRSEEHRRRLSEARKAYWAKRKGLSYNDSEDCSPFIGTE